ncbi:MAG: hypothetical protein K6T75_02380 [Acetobacteraceae bacterium]|nr:hypothetical protein [Acetobacteraceae bacterium]
MALVGTRGRVQSVLELSGLAQVVPLFRSERAAVAAVEGGEGGGRGAGDGGGAE